MPRGCVVFLCRLSLYLVPQYIAPPPVSSLTPPSTSREGSGEPHIICASKIVYIPIRFCHIRRPLRNYVMFTYVQLVHGSPDPFPIVNPRPRVGGRRVIVVGLCVCVVRPSIVFLENGGSSERQTWTCYEVPQNKTMERRGPGKLEKRTAAAVSVH